MAVFNLEFRNSLFKEPFGNADGVRLSAWKHEPHPTSRDVTSNHGWWLTLPRIDGDSLESIVDENGLDAVSL